MSSRSEGSTGLLVPLWRRRAFALGLCATILGCVAGDADQAPRRLALTGSSTVAPLAAEIARRFEAEHPGTRIDVQTGGSSRGIADARSGAADIGMISRDLRPEEADLFAFAIARDGIGITVHRDNPVRQLSPQQVRDIYTGRITRWNQVGGRDAAITVINKAEGRSTLELFLDHFGLKNSEIRADVVVGDNQQEVKTLTGNPDAIGYVSIGTAEYEAARGAPIRLLPLEGREASSEAVRGGSYPLMRSLNLITRPEPEGLAKEFIEFARSNRVSDLVRAQAFVPLAP